MSSFWRNWMIGWCGAIGLFGIVLAGGSLEATSEPVRILFNLLSGSEQWDFNPPLRFSLAVLGAVSIGWSLTLFAAIQAANQIEKQQRKFIWILITASVLSWYVIDSILSIATGFGLNVIANTLFAIAFLLPVLSSGVLFKQTDDTI